MTDAELNPSPYCHLDPSIWRVTKVTHITLTVVGTLFLIPAAGVIVIFWNLTGSLGSLLSDGTETTMLVSTAMIGTVSGVLTWCALCLLYFKRCDIRWQRITWTTCALFGYITTPCITCWILFFLINEPATGAFQLLFIAILITSITCIVIGRANSRLAIRRLKYSNLNHQKPKFSTYLPRQT